MAKPEVKVDAVESKKKRKEAKLAKDAVEEAEVDEAEAKRLRKAAKAAKKASPDAVENETAEVDPAEAKRLRKAAKKAAALAAEEEQPEVDPIEVKKQKKTTKEVEPVEGDAEVDPAEAKRLRKAAKKAALEAAEKGEEEVDAAEAKRLRKAAKKAAAEAAAAGAEETPAKAKEKRKDAVELTEEAETPAKKKKKSTNDEDEGEKEAPKKETAVGEDPNPFRLFIGGVAYDVDQETLHKDFSECGEVVDIKLMMDLDTGRSKGIAFITMADQAGYDAALKYDGQEYAGRPLNVSKAKSTGNKGKGKDGKGEGKGKGKDKGKSKGKGIGEKPDGCTSVVVKGLSYEVTSEDLTECFKNCGKGATNVKLLCDADTGASRGMAFVDFDDTNAVDEAMKLTETFLKGRAFFMRYSEPRW